MTLMTRTRFDVVPLSKHIGAEIRGLDLREKPDDETVRAVYQAWLDHLVIVFPGQNLSQEDLIRVTGYFGELGELSRPAKYFPKGYSRLLPGIMLISNIRENGEPRQYAVRERLCRLRHARPGHPPQARGPQSDAPLQLRVDDRCAAG